MARHMMQASFVLIIFSVAGLAGTATAADHLTAAQIKTLRKSVGKVECNFGANRECGTGFLVEARVEGKVRNALVTALHIAPSVSGVKFAVWMDGESREIECKPIAWSQSTDLLVLVSNQDEFSRFPSLKIASKESSPVVGDATWLFGAHCGHNISVQRGDLVTDRILAPQFQRLFLPGPGEPAPAILRHNANSSKGCSGGPLLNTNGEVIGVEHGAIVGANGEFLAVDSQHILELGLASGEFKRKGTFRDVPPTDVVATHAFTPFRIDAFDTALDVDCLIFGPLRLEEDSIRHVLEEDKRLITGDLAAKVRAEVSKLARIQSSEFGLEFLAPPATKVVAEPIQDADQALRWPGIQFQVSVENAPQSVQPIKFYVFDNRAYRELADQAFIRSVVARGFDPLGLDRGKSPARAFYYAETTTKHVNEAVLIDFLNRAKVSASSKLLDEKRFTLNSGSRWLEVEIASKNAKRDKIRVATLGQVTLVAHGTSDSASLNTMDELLFCSARLK